MICSHRQWIGQRTRGRLLWNRLAGLKHRCRWESTKATDSEPAAEMDLDAFVAAEEEQEPPYSLLDPGNCITTDPVQHKGTLVWLHGLGQDMHQVSKLLRMAPSSTVRYVAPQGPLVPITVLNEEEKPCWFDVVRDDAAAIENDDGDDDEQEPDWIGLERSSEMIHALLEREMQTVPASKIVLAGFGEGASAALFAGLSFPERLAGILCVSGEPMCPPKWQVKSPQTPVFAYNGNRDVVVPFERAQQSYDYVRDEYHVQIELHKDVEMEHVMSPSCLMHCHYWWNARIASG